MNNWKSSIFLLGLIVGVLQGMALWFADRLTLLAQPQQGGQWPS